MHGNTTMYWFNALLQYNVIVYLHFIGLVAVLVCFTIVVWYNAVVLCSILMQCSAVWGSVVMQFSSVCCNTVWCSAVWLMKFCAVWGSAVCGDAIQCSVIFFSVVLKLSAVMYRYRYR